MVGEGELDPCGSPCLSLITVVLISVGDVELYSPWDLAWTLDP